MVLNLRFLPCCCKLVTRSLQKFQRNYHSVSTEKCWRQFPSPLTGMYPPIRRMASDSSRRVAKEYRKKQSTALYITAAGVFVVGLTYAAVPMYRIFCNATGYGGTVSSTHDPDKVSKLKKIEDRIITIKFNADTAASMTWNFRPTQTEIKVMPGETALAFYTAKNPTDHQVIGISTYNVLPFDAGKYFNKIQCFCFEEQMLNPHEQVDMPVFFYIDPEFDNDPWMEKVNEIILSYTFFEAKDVAKMPLPAFPTGPVQLPQKQTA